MSCRSSVVALVAFLSIARATYADVVRVEIARRQDITGSSYEKLSGTVFFDGGFSSDVYVLRPRDPARGNGSLLLEVNRERTVLRSFNRGGPNTDPESSADLGDGFLMRFGFAVAWIGSEVDLSEDRRFVAVRDVARWIKHQPNAAISARYVYAFGSAETRRFLNERQVFDAVWVHGASGSPPAVQADLKAFFTNTASDYWTGRTGPRDELPENVRAYYFAGTQSVPARLPPGVDYWWTMRALLLALHRWVSTETAPPPSASPTPGDRANVDEDGNERAGLLLPDVAVPLATYTATSATSFPRTRAARAAARDPRRSIEERYASRDDYLGKVRDAAEALVKRGYLLFDDVDRIVQRANDTWDAVSTSRD